MCSLTTGSLLPTKPFKMENLAKTSEEKNAKQHIFVIYQNVSTSIKGNSRKIEKQ